MSYDPILEGVKAMAIGMCTGSASEGIETVETAEQNRAQAECNLPIRMIPSKEAFEALGFIFEDIDDDILCKATLPKGWKLKASENEYGTDLIDEKGRKRGSSFYKGAFYDRNGHMNLSQRFNIAYNATNPEKWEGPYTVLVKDADGTILFTAGKYEKIYSDEYCALMDQAEEYLRTNYPEWKDPTKYWD